MQIVQLDLSGTILDSTGAPFEFGDLNLTVRSFSGGSSGTELAESSVFSFTDETGAYTASVSIPTGSDTVLITTDLPGTDPVELTGLTSPSNIRVADFTTDP